jgi:hypothetical protein
MEGGDRSQRELRGVGLSPRSDDLCYRDSLWRYCHRLSLPATPLVVDGLSTNWAASGNAGVAPASASHGSTPTTGNGGGAQASPMTGSAGAGRRFAATGSARSSSKSDGTGSQRGEHPSSGAAGDSRGSSGSPSGSGRDLDSSHGAMPGVRTHGGKSAEPGSGGSGAHGGAGEQGPVGEQGGPSAQGGSRS